MEIDKKTLEGVYKRNYSNWLSYLTKRVSRDNAEDILQNAFIAMLESNSYNSKLGKIDFWCFGILRNKLNDFFREGEDSVVFNDEILQNVESENQLNDSEILLRLNNVENPFHKRVLQEVYYNFGCQEKSARNLGIKPVTVRQICKRFRNGDD